VVTLSSPASYSANHVPAQENGNTTPQGALAIMGTDGKPYGFVNAEEVTAFRTALASSLLITRRRKVKTITVFGAGKQAYWHVRLALLLKGPTIKRVHFIVRDFNERSAGIMKTFVSHSADIKQREGWFETTFDLTSLQYVEIGRILKERLRKADIIMCTTPSTEPLFDHTILTNTEGRKRPRLVIAIGSYKPHMVEVPPEVFSQAVKIHGPGHHFHKRAEEGGVIVVDTIACVKEAGELVQAGVKSKNTVELGELTMLEQMNAEKETDESAIEDSPRGSMENTAVSPQDFTSSLAQALRGTGLDSPANGGGSKAVSRKSSRASFNLSRKPSLSFRKRAGSVSSVGGRKKQQTESEDQMSRWLSGGNVIYKSVGMGLMDLVMGAEMVKLAKAKKIGTTVKNF
jgi:ornithine cyclodeaminase/alanine dehydrogenase-like protein (mu-crystallin family)